MPLEFEALVGYLYVVGGRLISTTPSGIRAETAPRNAARGREADTMFVLALPAENAVAPPNFYEHLARQAAERYFASTGSVTAGLRDSFHALNHDLVERAQQEAQPVHAHLLCAVLRGSDLIVGRVGRAATVVLANGALQAFPESWGRGSLLGAPLGAAQMPDIKMSQFPVKSGTRVIFGDAHLVDIALDQISGALMSVDVGAVLVGLKELARLQATWMVAEFVPPGMPSSDMIPEGQSTMDIAAKMRDETARTRAASASDASRYKPRKAGRKVFRQVKRGVGQGALFFSRMFLVAGKMTDRFWGGQNKSGRRWLASPIGLGIAAGLPIVVIVAVMLLWLSNTGESEFELCIQGVDERVELARSPSVVNNSRQTVINAWNLVLTQVDRCNVLRPGDPALAALRREGQGVLDNLNDIVRREAGVIDALPEASLSRIVAQGQNLYVLDSHPDHILVYQITLSNDGMQAARPGTAIPEMRDGGRASGIPVGDIFDITINEQGTIIAVDRTGVIVECSPRFLQCTGQRLLGVENWVNPIAVTVWNNRIYILDNGANDDDGQIWRYDPSGGSYSVAPAEYFAGDFRPPLRSAVDFDIDGSGNVYVLLAEGRLLKFWDGTPQSFQFAVFPEGQELVSATAMYLDDRPTSQNIYVIDQYRRAIHETSLIGNFRNSYRTYDETLFDLLSGAAVLPVGGGRELIYAISGNTVLVLPKE